MGDGWRLRYGLGEWWVRWMVGMLLMLMEYGDSGDGDGDGDGGLNIE